VFNLFKIDSKLKINTTMQITAQDVNKLRQITGAGMMDCKKALTEANGDIDAAIEFLRKQGQKVSEKRADRETSEGAVVVRISADNKSGYAMALGCETDFVAKNDEFVALANAIADVVAANDIDTVAGAVAAKFKDGRSIGENLIDYIGKIGEKIEITKVAKVSAASVVTYLHSNNKLGVLVGLSATGADDAGKDVAMQIAAMNPIALKKEEVSQEIIDRELALGKEMALAEGKPAAIVDKIAQGKLTKYFKDNTLLEQDFVKDSSKTVAQMLDGVQKGLTVAKFERVAIG
jgi:elongation factor Ts